MTIEMKGEYRGYGIEWMEYNRTFTISLDGVRASDNRKSLEECEKWIDAKLKEKFNRVDILHIGWRGELTKGVATSLLTESGKTYVWMSDAKKKRSKESIDSIYLDNSINRNLLLDISNKRAQVRALEGEVQELMNQMEHLTEDLMVTK